MFNKLVFYKINYNGYTTWKFKDWSCEKLQNFNIFVYLSKTFLFICLKVENIYGIISTYQHQLQSLQILDNLEFVYFCSFAM